jgi:hypothetical protein
MIGVGWGSLYIIPWGFLTLAARLWIKAMGSVRTLKAAVKEGRKLISKFCGRGKDPFTIN